MGRSAAPAKQPPSSTRFKQQRRTMLRCAQRCCACFARFANFARLSRFARMLAQIGGSIHEGVAGVRRYDPSITSNSQAALTYSGLHAVWCYRISHRLWIRGHELAAQIVCQLGRMVTGVEIHPAATLGKRLLIDHGTGIVIGETAVIGDDVVLYQGVTLGSVENHAGRRHPQLGSGVFVGAGAKILGAIIIGDNAKIGANAVVLHDVPADATAVGVPAHIVGANR